jgi:phosphate/sulfate permease
MSILRVIPLQFVTCAAFGVIGLMLSAIAVHWFVNDLGMERTIIPVLAVYLGMFSGVCFGGYRFIKQVGKHRETIRFILQGIVGLLVGLAISLKFLLADDLVLPKTLGGVVLILSPLAGLWLGFNYNLVRKRRSESNTDRNASSYEE